MHVKSKSIRYPNYLKGEDSVYLDSWAKKDLALLSRSQAYLFIRCYHGNNTWELEHFKRRMRNSPKKLLMYIWYRYFIRNLSKHPHFALSGNLEKAINQFIADSKNLGII
jgi:hypothetical protein